MTTDDQYAADDAMTAPVPPPRFFKPPLNPAKNSEAERDARIHQIIEDTRRLMGWRKPERNTPTERSTEQ